ncbi:MAG: hypothetical protein CMN30_06490 [Sandaracinus sp.]|nr:hypothetical protein [Sandaracinus sp.]
MILALGVGCGDDDGDDGDSTMEDMYTPPQPDLGMEDMGEEPMEDGGIEEDAFVEPDDAVYVRVAHLIPDAPNVRLCIGPPGLATPLPPLPSQAEQPDGIPFRAVGEYITLPIEGVTAYEARIFDVDTIGDGDCSLTDDPLLSVEVVTSTLTPFAHYTVAAIGFVQPGDFTCLATASACGDDKAARVAIYPDAEADTASAQTRVLHSIPNAPNVDVCYDPDGSEGDMDPVEIIDDLAFGDASDYHVTTEAIAAGSFRIFVHNPIADCTATPVLPELYELTVPTPAAVVAGFEPSFGDRLVQTEYAVGSVHTIVAEGVAGVNAPDPGFAAFVPLVDLSVE